MKIGYLKLQKCSIKILLTSSKIWVNQSKKILHPTWKTNGIKSKRSMILFIKFQSLTSAHKQLRFPDTSHLLLYLIITVLFLRARNQQRDILQLIFLAKIYWLTKADIYTNGLREQKGMCLNINNYSIRILTSLVGEARGAALSVIIMRNVRCSDNIDIVITHCTVHLSLNTTDASHIIVISYQISVIFRLPPIRIT